MIDAAEALRVIGEAQAELAGPLLNPRYEDRVIFVGDTHGAIDVTQTVIDKSLNDHAQMPYLANALEGEAISHRTLEFIESPTQQAAHRTLFSKGNTIPPRII